MNFLLVNVSILLFPIVNVLLTAKSTGTVKGTYLVAVVVRINYNNIIYLVVTRI